MVRRNKIFGAVLLSAGIAAYGQSSTTAPSSVKTHHKSGDKALQERLDRLEERAAKVDELQHEVDDIKKQLAASNAALAASKADAAAEAPKVQAVQAAQAAAPQAEAVAALQASVSDLNAKSDSMALTVAATEKKTKALEMPETIHFKGVEVIPGGYLAAETVNRQRAIGGDVNTQFTGIPFGGQTAGVLSEFNASGRQSRISLLAEGKLAKATLRGYYEADFLSAGTTSNDNQSNSYTLRQRQVWAQAALNSGWTITGGQMWSLATEYNSGLSNGAEAIPQTIDAQYNVGFTWERQYGFRVVKKMSDKFWLGGAVEEAQTLNIGGHNLPTIVYQQTGNSGGLYNPTANYSYNFAPDLIAKAVYEPSFGHFEVFGIGRFFRDRVFPNATATPASAAGAFTAKAQGGGIGANAHVYALSKKVDVSAHFLIGDGVGRYGSATLADATAHSDGSLELLTSASALGKVEWHATPRLDVYGYYGGEYVKRAFYATGLFVTTAGPALGQPVLAGYGAPTNIVSGCYTEVLPVASANGGGFVPGTAANCTADNRNIQEGTFGYWYRFYRGPHGTLQQGIQYSYAERHTWQGIGNPLSGLGGSPKAIDNMVFTSFRYYLPK